MSHDKSFAPPPKMDDPPPEDMPEGEGKKLFPGMEPHQYQKPVPYGKLFLWAKRVVSAVLGLFLANTALAAAVTIVTQYNMHLLTTILSSLSRGGSNEEAARDISGETGFFSLLLPDDVKVATIVFAVLGMTILFLRYAARWLTLKTNNTMQEKLQLELHDKLLNLGPSYHSQNDSSKTRMTVTGFSSQAQEIFAELISFPLIQGISLLMGFYFLSIHLRELKGPAEARLFLVALLFVLPLMGWWFAKRIRRASEEQLRREVDLMNEFDNSAVKPLEVQLMGAQAQRSKSFAMRLKSYMQSNIAAAMTFERANMAQVATPDLLQTMFLVYGIFFVDASNLGAILGLYYFVPKVVEPFQNIITFFTSISLSWPQVEQVIEVLEAEPEIKEREGATDLSPTIGSVALDGVVFSYNSDGNKIFDDLTHVFDEGRTTAIVAMSGGGKSSLLNLVARLFDPQGGRIRVGEQDISEVTLSSLRRQVVKLSQFPMWINDTVRANFQLARAHATDEEMEAACRRTGIWEVLEKKIFELRNPPVGESWEEKVKREARVRVISALTGKNPDAFTPLDYIIPREIGSKELSGGQSRLLAVSRILLADSRVLLIDEPTTGVDLIKRREIAHILRQVCEGRTVLLVDHDISFVHQVADRVCCLEKGKFTSVGTPDELRQKPSLYMQLYEAGQWLRPKSVKKLVDVRMDACSMETADVMGQSMPGLSHHCPNCNDPLCLPDAHAPGRYVIECARCGFEHPVTL